MDDESLGSEAKFLLIAMLPASVMCCLSMGIVASEAHSKEDVELQGALEGIRATWRRPGLTRHIVAGTQGALSV